MTLNLREIRKEKGFTQEAMAKASGVSQSQIARYESGQRQPRPGTAQRIAAILGFSWTAFYETEAANGQSENPAASG